MKKIILTTSILFLLGSSILAQSKRINPALRHVVLFKFTDTAQPADVKRIEEAFRGLSSKIPFIKDFEWGINSSPENLNQGFTHCFLVTFTSDKDRDAYLVHRDHVAFVEILKPFLDKVTVIDYWSSK